jgi:hypothetical protein
LLWDRKKLNVDFYTDLDINKDVLMDRNTEISRLKNELLMLQDVNKQLEKQKNLSEQELFNLRDRNQLDFEE